MNAACVARHMLRKEGLGVWRKDDTASLTVISGLCYSSKNPARTVRAFNALKTITTSARWTWKFNLHFCHVGWLRHLLTGRPKGDQFEGLAFNFSRNRLPSWGKQA